MAFPRCSFRLLLLLLTAVGLQAQQFQDIQLGLDYPDVTEQCLDALNSTVANCPSFLIGASVDNPRLDSEHLAALCTSACRTGLTSARSTIAAGCNKATDTITIDGVVFPATYVIDRFLYTYDLSCRKDAASGQYCDEVLTSWLGSGVLSTAQNCSDCMLGIIQTQLNSPFGYHPEFADDFSSMTSSCGAAQYAFTSPVPYAVSTNAPTTTPEATCSNPYVVQSGESCDSIATSKGVPTYAIIKAGALNGACTNLLAGASLCLPQPCTLYRVQYDDTCDSIMAANPGLTAVHLLAWNPNINALCTNVGDLAETLVCVTPPGGAPGEGTTTDSQPTPTSPPATAVPRPPNAKAESNAQCAAWYTIQDGDYCQSVSIRQQIALRDFYFLNPSIDVNCTNLWLDTAYCVEAVGDINTYTGYPYSTTHIYTLTSASYATTSNTLSTVAPVVTPIVQLPIAPGSMTNCAAYVDGVQVPAVQDQNIQPDTPSITSNINSCDYATTAHGVLLADFLAWNPSLASVQPCMLQPGYRYCSLNSTSSSPPQNATNGLCLDDAGAPYAGTISTCSCFTRVYGRDVGARLCSDIADDGGITLASLVAWNPWVGDTTQCDTNVYSGLNASDTRPVCIGVGGSTGGPTTTTRPTQTSTSSATATSTTASAPSPTQAGMPANCTKYHQAVDGDGCWAIANEYGITLDQFYAWNPAVGNDCGGLWLDYYYCVAVS